MYGTVLRIRIRDKHPGSATLPMYRKVVESRYRIALRTLDCSSLLIEKYIFTFPTYASVRTSMVVLCCLHGLLHISFLYLNIQGLVTEDPNCVVLGDAVDGFSYQNLNTAFRLYFLVYLVSHNNRP
jgi:hypothetical protein